MNLQSSAFMVYYLAGKPPATIGRRPADTIAVMAVVPGISVVTVVPVMTTVPTMMSSVMFSAVSTRFGTVR